MKNTVAGLTAKSRISSKVYVKENIYFHYFIFFRVIEFISKIKLLKNHNVAATKEEIEHAVTGISLFDITSQDTIAIGNQFYQELIIQKRALGKKFYSSQLRNGVTKSCDQLFITSPSFNQEQKIKLCLDRLQSLTNLSSIPATQTYSLNQDVTKAIYNIASKLCDKDLNGDCLIFNIVDGNKYVPANNFTTKILDFLNELGEKYIPPKGKIRLLPKLSIDSLIKLFGLVVDQVAELRKFYIPRLLSLDIYSTQPLSCKAGNQAESSSSSAENYNDQESHLGQKRSYSSLSEDDMFNQENDEPLAKKQRFLNNEPDEDVATQNREEDQDKNIISKYLNLTAFAPPSPEEDSNYRMDFSFILNKA